MSETMTGAELQTLREACGMSREELAGLVEVQARTVKFWESGRSGVPADVADLMRRVDATVSLACSEALHQVRRAALEAMEYPADLVLLRYGADDAERYQVRDRFASLGPMCGAQAAAIQGAIVNRVRLTLPWFTGFECVAVRVVWVRSELYEAWRATAGLVDNEATRSQWAGGQVAAQATAHKADQPPVSGVSGG